MGMDICFWIGLGEGGRGLRSRWQWPNQYLLQIYVDNNGLAGCGWWLVLIYCEKELLASWWLVVGADLV